MTNGEKRLILALHDIRSAAVDRNHTVEEPLGIIDVLAFEGLRDTGGLDTYPSELREELEAARLDTGAERKVGTGKGAGARRVAVSGR